VLRAGAGATGTTAGGGATFAAGAGATGTVRGAVLVVDVDAAVRLAARDPMIPRKPPTESSAVTVRDRAAAWRRCEVGSREIMRPSLGGISQNWLRAH